MKLLFLDSNIFLSFYSFTSEDLDQLKKLVDSVKSKEIELYLTDQVRVEFSKNRDKVIAEAYEQFDSSSAAIKMPLMCKEYPEYGDITKLQRLIDKLKSNLKNKILVAVHEQKLKADIVINDLFAVATKIDSSAYLDKALQRHRLGKPPGKKDRSCGDEVNWEALLDKVANNGDFVLVSDDGDFANAMSKGEIMPILREEWRERKNGNIFLYKTLSQFFKEHDIDIQLREEERKNKLIEEMINSESFFMTHEIIRKLGEFNSFTNDQLMGLSTALLGNSQVKWIISDEDVKSFYSKNLGDKSDIFDPETWSQIRAMIFEQPGEGEDIDKEIESTLKTLEAEQDSEQAETTP